MTGENRRANAEAEMARAEECLREARVLHRSGLPFGAASRAYYVVFHAARALLLSVGIESKTHRSVASLLGEHFVKTGRLSPELGRAVSRMQRDREDADYQTGAVFTIEEAASMVAQAEAFRDAVRGLLGAP